MSNRAPLLLLAASVCACLMTTACSRAEATAAETPTTFRASDYQIYFDVTPSVTPGQRRQWAEMAEHDLLPALRDGSRVELYGLHDHTEDAAPAFRASLPIREDGAGMAEDMEYRQKKEGFRQGFLEGVRTVLAEQHAQARNTSVLGAFDRVPSDCLSRDCVLILFTDSLESRDPVNPERAHLGPSQIPAAIQSVAERRRWNPNKLKGVRVYFVLNSLAIGTPTPGATDRLTLALFWRTLTTAMGGELENWDTHFERLP
jgi:hypothetical protein